MQIFVDADACPVVGIVEKIAKQYHIPVILLCDTNHVLDSDYSEVIVVGAGADAVDYKLISICHKGDIVVSQDYGVAAMALAKGAYAIHQSGKWYTDENIDRMLMERHLNKKARRSSSKNHMKGPKKRTNEDDEHFARSFEKLVRMARRREVEYDLHFLSDDGQGPIVIYISGEHDTQQVKEVYDRVKSSDLQLDFCELLVHDWDRFLTPWPAVDCMKDRDFTGEGMVLLECLKEDILSHIIEKFPGKRKLYLAGYSLAGLFSLWSLYESGLFDGAVCGSPSLWYPGWKDYMIQNHLQRKVAVYLSLGRREPESRHMLMRQSGEIMRLQYESLQADEKVEAVTFRWEDGGHFTDVVGRMAYGVRWIVSSCDKCRKSR